MTNYTVKYILGKLLQNAISLYQEQAGLSCPEQFERLRSDFPEGKHLGGLMPPSVTNARKEVDIGAIPLSRGKDATKVLYISAIALKLAPLYQNPPMAIATELANYCRPEEGKDKEEGADTGVLSFSSVSREVFRRLGAETASSLLSTSPLRVDVVPPGMVVLQLTDSGIAAWLEYFCTVSPPLTGKSQSQGKFPSVDSDYLFQIQYSHARCCSLLGMANRDRLITLATSENSLFFQNKIETPTPIPWQETDGRLRLDTPVERRLISQLFATSDTLYFPRANSQQINWQKLAHTLSEAFQKFYSKCRIWGEVKIENPQLAQARLGLVLATQSFLGLMLEEKLGVEAPLEL